MINSTIHRQEIDVPADTYLTDGSRLYCVLDSPGTPQRMVTLEDCLSLDVFLIDARRIATLQRVKSPAGGPSPS
jgi:hypothetical protein